MSDRNAKDEEKAVEYTEDVQTHTAGSNSTTDEKDTASNVWAGTPEERKLKRKIDAIIYPLSGLIIFVQVKSRRLLSRYSVYTY